MTSGLDHVSRRVSLVAAGASEGCVAGVVRFAQEHGWHLSGDLDRVARLPRGWTGDGIVIALPDRAGMIPQLTQAGIPCVAFTTDYTTAAVPLVGPDEVAIGRMAADYLIERGFQTFACAPFSVSTINAGRLYAFRERVTERGFSYRVLPPAYDRPHERAEGEWIDRRRALVGQLRQLPARTAIFAYDDGVATDLVDSIRHAGLLIPEDIAVLGVGNSVFSAGATVPISTVELDLERLGYQAAALLHEQMSAAVAPVSRAVAPKGVVTRVSTETGAVADERVMRALAFIEQSFSDPALGVDCVARAVGMSRRNLERSFRHETGRTIHEHIVNIRMREAARLLAETPAMRAADVARQVGLVGERTFYRVFRRHFGKTPKAHGSWASRVGKVSAIVPPTVSPGHKTTPEEEASVPIGPGTSCSLA